MSFDPTCNFKPGEEIEVTLTRSLTSTGGAELDQPFVYRFVVETEGGTGIFVDSQSVAGQVNAIAVVAGDWDGDGDLDLAVSNFSSNSVAVFRNDGIGNFFSLSAVGGQIGVSALAWGDFNGDGFLDLAAADYGSDSVHIMTNQP